MFAITKNVSSMGTYIVLKNQLVSIKLSSFRTMLKRIVNVSLLLLFVFLILLVNLYILVLLKLLMMYILAMMSRETMNQKMMKN